MQERRSSCAVGWLAGWLAGWLWLAMAGYGWVKVVQSWLAERWLAKPVFSNCSQAAHCFSRPTVSFVYLNAAASLWPCTSDKPAGFKVDNKML